MKTPINEVKQSNETSSNNQTSTNFQFIDNRVHSKRITQLQKTANKHTSEQNQPIQNKTGLPNMLKSGIENLSEKS